MSSKSKRSLLWLVLLFLVGFSCWYFFLKPPWHSPNKFKVRQTLRHFDCYKDLISVVNQDTVFLKLWKIRNLGHQQPADTLSRVNGVYRLLDFDKLSEIIPIRLKPYCLDTFKNNLVPEGLRVPDRNTIGIEIATIHRHHFPHRSILYGRVSETHVLVWSRDPKEKFNYYQTLHSYRKSHLVKKEELDDHWTYLIVQSELRSYYRRTKL